MFDKIRLFAARALFALVAVMSLGLGLLVAGVAAVIGVMMVVALRIAMGSTNRHPQKAASDDTPVNGSPSATDAQPA